GKVSYLHSLWLFRILSGLAFAGGGLLVMRGLDRAGLPLAKWIFALFYVIEAKAIAFSMNGMETAWMLLFLGWAGSLFEKDSAVAWLPRGLCWAGLMWTRPDSAVYVVVLALGQLAFSRDSRKQTFVSLLKSAAVCSLVYLPWFVWAWSYYGSPIPH